MITPINSSDSLLEDEATSLSLTELYNTILENDEIIITIPASEESSLRTGLAGVKAKQNLKLRNAGLTPDSASLSFTVTPHKTIPDAVDIHILLAKKNAITVLAMRKPDDEI